MSLGLGFRVRALGLRAVNSGFGVEGLFGLVFRVWGFRF